MVDDPGPNAATLALINLLKLGPILSQNRSLGYMNVIVPLPPSRLTDVALRPEVVSIQPYFVPRLLDERQDQIMAGHIIGNEPSGPGYLAWLASKGFTQQQFTASGFAVDVSDDGLDNATTHPNHFGLYENGDINGPSRVVYARREPAGTGEIRGCEGHGNLNAHIIGAFNNLSGFPHADASGFRYGLGTAPFVRLGSSVIFDESGFTDPDYEDLQSRAYRDGARISSNSWGGGSGGAYNSDSQRYDALVRDAQPTGSAVPVAGNQEMVMVFAAGNSGPGANTVGSPGTGKNVLTVGASENVQSFSTANGGNNDAGEDGSGISDTGANSLNDMIAFSSRGPTDDSRFRPDIVAPGTHVTGGVFQAASPGPNGTADPCFNAGSVSALPGKGTPGDPDNFFPQGQEFYTTSSGTSHSTPAVAGTAALVRQWFINQGSNPASPAMTKAFLMNSARYMTGVGANDTLPSSSQGMGLVDLERAFDSTPRILRDQIDLFTASGQSMTWTGTISDASQPFRVTVAWTDAPGNTVGNAFNNNLDLTVVAGGNVYKGNVFSGPNSVPGGSADPRNNVESVFLPAGTTGPVAVIVTATNINSNGVPNNASNLDQDFALVVYNAVSANLPVLAAQSATLSTGSLDPNECNNVNIPLKNWGTVTASGVFLTLGTSTPGAQVTQAVSAYPPIFAGGTATNTTPFQISTAASFVCGTTVALTAAVTAAQDGVISALGLGSGSSTTTAFASTDVPKAIPDEGQAESVVSVSGIAGPITKVTASLHITHTFDADLEMLLVGPDLTTIDLSAGNGGSGDNYGSSCSARTVFDDAAATSITAGAAPFVGTFRPEDPLSAFVGKSGSAASGTWKLRVKDNAAVDIGTLQCWTLNVSQTTCTPGAGQCQVVTPPATTELVNISTRALVETGNNIMIGGLIIQGTAPKTVLLRGRGPALADAPFNVPGALSNPLLRLFSGPTLVAQNDNWQSPSTCTVACGTADDIAHTGLDPCQPNPGQPTPPPGCAQESALLVTLPPGGYTFQLSGAGGETGVGLVEAFEADGNLTPTKLANISTRGIVRTGANIMIGGIIVDGPSPKKVLLRGRGPALEAPPFSLSGVLGNPFLRLFSGANLIAQNDNWQDAPFCNGGFTCGGAAEIVATGLDPCQPNPGQPSPPPNCALESAILITLPPGGYTVQLSGASSEEGLGLVEAFEAN